VDPEWRKVVKELEVTVIVRNNRLKERRLALGMNQFLLAGAAGISHGVYQALECMRSSPLTDTSRRPGRDEEVLDWSNAAKALATFHEVEPEELFPDAVQHVHQDRVVRRVDIAEVRSSLAAAEMLPGLPEGLVDMEFATREMRSRIDRVLGTLTARESEILSKRFGLGDGPEKTHSAIAEEQKVTAGRIGQIEAKALRKLRHPSRAKALRSFIDDPPAADPYADARLGEALNRAMANEERGRQQAEKINRRAKRKKAEAAARRRELERSFEGTDEDVLVLICVPCGQARAPIQIWPRSKQWLDLIWGWKEHFGIPTTKSETEAYLARADLGCAYHKIPMVVEKAEGKS
jgi:transcriptional regulator with XRE-family HTH domain